MQFFGIKIVYICIGDNTYFILKGEIMGPDGVKVSFGKDYAAEFAAKNAHVVEESKEMLKKAGITVPIATEQPKSLDEKDQDMGLAVVKEQKPDTNKEPEVKEEKRNIYPSADPDEYAKMLDEAEKDNKQVKRHTQ